MARQLVARALSSSPRLGLDLLLLGGSEVILKAKKLPNQVSVHGGDQLSDALLNHIQQSWRPKIVGDVADLKECLRVLDCSEGFDQGIL